MKNHDITFDSFNNKISDSNEQLKNINAMISILIEKSSVFIYIIFKFKILNVYFQESNLEKEIPEKFLKRTPEEIKNEIEFLKAKSAIVQSSVDDLKIEVIFMI